MTFNHSCTCGNKNLRKYYHHHETKEMRFVCDTCKRQYSLMGDSFNPVTTPDRDVLAFVHMLTGVIKPAGNVKV